MLILREPDAGRLYSLAHEALVRDGDAAAPRGRITREIGVVALELSIPRQHLAAIYGRRLNPFLMLAEVLWMLSGRDDNAFISRFSKGVSSFVASHSPVSSDAYGPRLRRAPGVGDQLAAIVQLLERDGHTRRAFLSLWDTTLDMATDAFAVPCNIGVDFKLRSHGLRMTVFNRSNDLHIGFLFNLVQFGLLGEIIAMRLGVSLMVQTHVTTSLHVYSESPISHRLSTGVRLFDLYSAVQPLIIGTIDDSLLKQAVAHVDVVGASNTARIADLSWARSSPWLQSTMLLLEAHLAFEAQAYERALDLFERAPQSDWWVLAAEMFARRLARRRAQSALDRLARLVGQAVPDALAFVTAESGRSQ